VACVDDPHFRLSLAQAAIGKQYDCVEVLKGQESALRQVDGTGNVCKDSVGLFGGEVMPYAKRAGDWSDTNGLYPVARGSTENSRVEDSWQTFACGL
jgi:hypothetical protein